MVREVKASALAIRPIEQSFEVFLRLGQLLVLLQVERTALKCIQVDRLHLVNVDTLGELGSESSACHSDEEVVPLDVDDAEYSIAVKFAAFEVLLLDRHLRVDSAKIALFNYEASLL